MALVNCTECGKEFSNKAASCPNCGCPITEMPDALSGDEVRWYYYRWRDSGVEELLQDNFEGDSELELIYKLLAPPNIDLAKAILRQTFPDAFNVPTNTDIKVINGKEVNLFDIVKIYGNGSIAKIGACAKLSLLTGLPSNEAKLIMEQYYNEIGERANIPYFERLNNQLSNDKKTPSSYSSQVSCPKCGSTQIQIVPRKWSLMTGIFTNKVDRVCVNCKCKF